MVKSTTSLAEGKVKVKVDHVYKHLKDVSERQDLKNLRSVVVLSQKYRWLHNDFD